MRSLSRFLLLVTALASASVPVHAQQWGKNGFTISIIGSSSQFGVDVGAPVNNSGQVAGDLFVSPNPVAGRYSPGTGITSFGSLAGGYTNTGGINNLGQTVGYSAVAGGYHVFRSTNGALEDLGSLTSSTYGVAFDINDHGQVVGYAENPTSPQAQAMRYTDGIGWQNLGHLGGGSWTNAWAINNSGQVVGEEYFADGRYHAYRYTDGSGFLDLGSLIGGSHTYAMNINDAGQVTGYANVGSGTHAYRYVDGIGMQDLGLGFGESRGFAIDNSGRVVGGAYTATGWKAAFWEGTNVFFLEALAGTAGWRFDSVLGISDDGSKMVAIGRNAAGFSGSVLLSALEPPTADPAVAPEPATIVLLGSGLAGLALAARRRRPN